MKGLLLASSLLGTVLASAHDRHAAFHYRRAPLESGTPGNDSCVCTTYTTYFYGEPTLVQDTPSSTSSSVSSTSSSSPSSSSTPAPSSTVAPETPSSYASAPSSSAKASSYEAVAPISSAVVAVESSVVGALGYTSSSAAAPAASSGASSGISVNGDKWAMTYTPYTDAGGCKSASQVMSDMQSIRNKGFTTVRTYSTDCSLLENIGAACEATGLKLALGVYISSSGASGAQSQVSDIANWAQWGLVELVIIGNEAIFNNYISASGLAGFISSAKGTLRAAGYNGPVTTTEPLNILQEYGSQLCGSMDAVSANIQAFFNSGVTAADAGDFVASQLEIVASICPGLPAYNLECGWPSSGSANGAAVPGALNQKLAMESIIAKAGSKTAVFSFSNDGWKSPGEYNVEQFFGCLDLF